MWPASFLCWLVMDVWEHALILDYKAIERVSYIEAFFPNINWKTVEHRLERTMVPTSIPALT